jgi:hypothetical protein
MQRVADRNARRERHAARARKEREERERKERRECEEHEREEERKEREERKRKVKRKVYTNANVPPSKRLNPGLLGLEPTPAPTRAPTQAQALAQALAPCVITWVCGSILAIILNHQNVFIRKSVIIICRCIHTMSEEVVQIHM